MSFKAKVLLRIVGWSNNFLCSFCKNRYKTPYTTRQYSNSIEYNGNSHSLVYFAPDHLVAVVYVSSSMTSANINNNGMYARHVNIYYGNILLGRT